MAIGSTVRTVSVCGPVSVGIVVREAAELSTLSESGTMGCSLRRESASVVRKRKPKITLNQSSSNKPYALNAHYNAHCVIEMPLSARPKAHK